MEIVIALCASIALGIGVSWWVGMFNPIGYLGIRPWNVPTCSHGVRVGDLGRCDHPVTVRPDRPH